VVAAGTATTTGKLTVYIKLYADGDGLQEMPVTLTATPAPEPATMSLLALGTIGLIRRKRA